MVKINIGTILNVAFTGAVLSTLSADAAIVDPRPASSDAVRAVGEAARVPVLAHLDGICHTYIHADGVVAGGMPR